MNLNKILNKNHPKKKLQRERRSIKRFCRRYGRRRVVGADGTVVDCIGPRIMPNGEVDEGGFTGVLVQPSIIYMSWCSRGGDRVGKIGTYDRLAYADVE